MNNIEILEETLQILDAGHYKVNGKEVKRTDPGGYPGSVQNWLRKAGFLCGGYRDDERSTECRRTFQTGAGAELC